MRSQIDLSPAMAPRDKRKRESSPSEESEPGKGLSEAYMAILRAMGAEENADLLTTATEQRVLEASATAFAHGNTAPVRPSAAVRQVQVDNARERGGIVNPDFAMHGPGEWRWLDAYDRHVAFTRFGGLTLPEGTLELRQNGTIPPEQGLNAEPFVVFFPDRTWVNPATRPAVPGRFEFLTPEADEHAQINFGGQDEYDLGGHPSAESIWNLRQELRERGRPDITHDIELVFVPSEANQASSQAPATANPDPADDAPSETDYDLKNFGQSDQTGTPGKAEHHAVWHKGAYRVMDRSRATQGMPEPHMFECFAKSGWRTWRQAPKMDWNSKKMVDKLNNWRDQNLRRGPFEQKRDQVRPDYTPEQRQWVTDEYRKALGRRKPTEGMAKLTERFNARFSASRTEQGIQSLWDRCRQEIDRFGELQPRRPRGKYQRKKAAQTGKIELVTVGTEEEKDNGEAKTTASEDVQGEGGEESGSEKDPDVPG